MEEVNRNAVVLIPEGGVDYHGISLVEVVWKFVAVIINFCFTTSIAFHDVLHGFRAGCVTCTASLEAKLLQQLKSIEGRGTIHNRYRPAQVVWRFGQEQITRYPGGLRHRTLGPPHPSRILGQDSDGGSYGGILWGIIPRFSGGDSGGTTVPTIFNVVVDAVVRH